METFFSSIKPSLKRHLIRRSLLFVLPGFVLLFYMGVFLKTSALEKWGLWGFALSFLLISGGMIPYRRIMRLETTPHKLSLEKEGLCFTHTKKGEVVFPLEQIEKFHFVERKGFYGIRIHFKNGKHFLLPYFSKKTFESLQSIQNKDV